MSSGRLICAWEKLLSSYERQYLFHVLLSERYSRVIDHKAGYTHNLVTILQILKMTDIVYVGSHIGIGYSNSLGCHHQIRTHRAGKRNQDLNIRRFRDGCNVVLNIRVNGLPRSGGIIKSQYKGGELMSTGDTVKGKACWCAI